MSINITTLLRLVVERDCSDLHISVGRSPVVRLHGRLRGLDMPPLSPEDTYAIIQQVAPERALEEFEEEGGADFAYAFEDVARFRVAIFQQKGNAGMVMRLIPHRILTFDQLGLPEGGRTVCDRPRGLVLVTGPTGCGKTTTLATMIDHINNHLDRHVITIEDPIEYYHSHKKSVITQREVGVDVPSFAEALRRSLRQDPDVILVGEMRDLETIHAAITAAETGHLVFATLHTTGAARTVDRIIDAFPMDQQEQIRIQLSVSIVSVISQVIMPRSDVDGLIAAFEIMIATPAIQNLIRENKTYRIASSIQTGRKLGMVLLDDSLFDLFIQKKISEEELMAKAQIVGEMRERVDEFNNAQKNMGK
ncbi:MAG: type IV pilus twitching motility protein PilT [Planctomycetota bacterium]|jgi:twitching motility protein PilT